MPSRWSFACPRIWFADRDLAGLEQRVLVLVEIDGDAVAAAVLVSGAQHPARFPLIERYRPDALRDRRGVRHHLAVLADRLAQGIECHVAAHRFGGLRGGLGARHEYAGHRHVAISVGAELNREQPEA